MQANAWADTRNTSRQVGVEAKASISKESDVNILATPQRCHQLDDALVAQSSILGLLLVALFSSTETLSCPLMNQQAYFLDIPLSC